MEPQRTVIERTEAATASFTTLPAEIRQQVLYYMIVAPDIGTYHAFTRRQMLREAIHHLSYVSPQVHADLLPVVHLLINHYTALHEACLAVEAQTGWARTHAPSGTLTRWANARKRRDGLEGYLRTLRGWERRAKSKKGAS